MRIRSALFTSMSGKLGGAVGSSARGGLQTLRKLVRPHNPQSSEQTSIRAYLTTLTARWVRTLTNAERALWTNLAGPSESGIDVYVANMVPFYQFTTGTDPALSAGYPHTRHCPTQTSLLGPPTCPFPCDTLVASTPDITDRKCAYLVYLSRPQRPSRLSQQHPFTLIGRITSDEGGDINVAIPTALRGDPGLISYARLIPLGYIDGGGDPSGSVGPAQIYRFTIG